MKRFVKIIGLLVVPVFWMLPIGRGIRFLEEMGVKYQESQSLNDFNDYRYAEMLLLCYSGGLVVSLMLCWLTARTGHKLFGVNLMLLGAVLFEIIRCKPEEVIVLIPSINPLLFAGIFLALGAPAVLATPAILIGGNGRELHQARQNRRVESA